MTMLASAPVATLRAAVDELLGADLSCLDQDALLALLRGAEVEVRRLAAVDHRLVAEVQARDVAGALGLSGPAQLLTRLLRVSPGEARARVASAGELAARRSPTEPELPARFPRVAAAQLAGDISPGHAYVITSTITALPAAVQAERFDATEAELLGYAATLNPAQLAVAAKRLSAYLNPDGVHTTDHDHQRRRDARLSRNDDGSGELAAHLTPAALAVWQAVLDPLAAPKPAADGERDPRTAGQRRHDALLDAGLRLLRSDLPECGGTPVTVAVTMTLEQLEQRTGYASTAHGGILSVAELLTLAAEADLIPVVLGDSSGIVAYGRSRRTASSGQRRALAARDHGCSFPGCDTPPAWAQAHHLKRWADGGATDIPNLTLVCGHHHRSADRLGWHCQMIDGLPHWIPPAWVDPARRPQRNTRIGRAGSEQALDTPADS